MAIVTYKHVDQRWADSFEKAQSIRLGTFSAYRMMEGLRADTSEGSQLNYFASGDQRIVRRFVDEKKGFVCAPKGAMLHFENCTFEERIPDHLIFCMSREPDFELCEREGLVPFAISLMAFAGALIDAHPPLMKGLTGTVRYDKSVGNIALGEIFDADPFQKSADFAWENEVRIVFEGTSIEGFVDVVAPNAAIAIKRLPL